MKTKLENGARTPEVIYNELTKYGRLEGIVNKDGLTYHYFTTPTLGEWAIEVTFMGSSVIATRQVPKDALDYLLPTRYSSSLDIKFGGF